MNCFFENKSTGNRFIIEPVRETIKELSKAKANVHDCSTSGVNVCRIIVFPSQCHVITYKLERFDKLLISADPFPSCKCMQIIRSGGNGTQNCDASVQKTLKRNVISVIKLI
jgi:hypothetical protein